MKKCPVRKAREKREKEEARAAEEQPKNRRQRDKEARGEGPHPPCVWCGRKNHVDSDCHRGGPWTLPSFWRKAEGKEAQVYLESVGLHWWIDNPLEEGYESTRGIVPHPPAAPPPTPGGTPTPPPPPQPPTNEEVQEQQVQQPMDDEDEVVEKRKENENADRREDGSAPRPSKAARFTAGAAPKSRAKEETGDPARDRSALAPVVRGLINAAAEVVRADEGRMTIAAATWVADHVEKCLCDELNAEDFWKKDPPPPGSSNSATDRFEASCSAT